MGAESPRGQLRLAPVPHGDRRAPVDQLAREEFDKALGVNVAAVFHTTQAVWPLMRQQGSGVLINISSLASVDPFTGFSVYGACKAWVNLFTKAIADEGRPLTA